MSAPSHQPTKDSIMDDAAAKACEAAGESLAIVSAMLHAHDVPDEIVVEVVATVALALRLNLECTPGAYDTTDLLEAVRRGMLRLRCEVESAKMTLQ